MLIKKVTLPFIFGLHLFSQQAHLLTSIVYPREEVMAEQGGVRMVRLKRDPSYKTIILANSKIIDANRSDPRIEQISREISVDEKTLLKNGKIYYDNRAVKLSRWVIAIQQAVFWKGWVICVVNFVGPTVSGASDMITSDVVYFNPQTMEGEIIFTGLPGFGLQVYLE